eukprot:gene15369-21453_t
MSTLRSILIIGLVASALAQDPPKGKTSSSIKSAGMAELYNGFGDVDPKGPCAADAKAFCKSVKAGEGRLAWCITKRMQATTKGNALGKKVGEKCVNALSAYKIDRSSNINKNAPLAKACKDNVEKLCGDKNDIDTPGSVLACLKEKKSDLGAVCRSEVFIAQEEAVMDYRTDYRLFKACKEDVENMCSDTSKRIQVSWECQNEMFQYDEETGDDIRLSTRLFSKCYNDYKEYCDKIEPGAMRVQECLEDNMDEDEFSSDCKEELEETISKRVQNFKLDKALRTACKSEFLDLCGTTINDMDGDEKTRDSALNCLQSNQEDIKSDDCKSEMHRRKERASRDIRFDEVLADACSEDRETYCTDVSPGIRSDDCKSEMPRRTERASRDIHFDEVLADACYEDRETYCTDVSPVRRRNSLGQKCSAALFDHEVKMAEDIDFKYPMKKACGWELKNFCKDIPHGRARITRCLEEHMDDVDMSKECKTEVVKDMNHMAQDHRLNFRLETACKEDISKLCPNSCSSTPGQSCGGLVLNCLQEDISKLCPNSCSSMPGQSCGGLVLNCLQERTENITATACKDEERTENITGTACKDEVFYYELMEVSDFRNDIILAEACRNDVDAYCKDIEPGEGRVHACLRFNREKISPRCLKEENKLATLEYSDIRLRPKLNKLCSEEKAVYCKETKPGKARVLKCLMENMAKPNFGEDCKEELQKREEGMKSDYRYDVGVFNNCANDVESFCQDEKSQLRGTAAVLKCLVNNFNSLEENCQVEMSRAVRLALWDYKAGAPLTAACDASVSSFCPKEGASLNAAYGASVSRISSKGASAKSGTDVFSIGVVGRCLSKALVRGKSLGTGCRNMVLAAAPRDARSFFDSQESSNSIVQKIADLQTAAGLEGALVDPYASGVSTVTVTGWVALVCIVSLIVVSVGGGIMLYRRATGMDKPHTINMKMGDA